MPKRLLLVYPRSFAVSYGDMQFVEHLINKRGLLNVGLATVAAMTPPAFRIRILDENFEAIDYDEPYDLVGITGFHVQLGQAREIAEGFRRRGIPVVCGGPSVSVSPERWRSFSDVLVIGEAENIWPRFCEDFLSGTYDDAYRETGVVDLATSPIPDYRAMSRAVIQQCYGGIVQTSRGCPFDCEFCDVIAYVGRTMRYKPVDRVLREVRQIHAMGLKFVVLADDNFTAGRAKSKEILRSLGAWNRSQRSPINFGTQLTLDAAKDDELLELATEAGLNRVLIGVESPNELSLAEANKAPNLRTDMVADLRRFHEHGIMVMGTSIVGFDNDGLDIFRRHFDFFMDAGILSPQPFPLQAPDATPLKERMIREGRYLDWNPTLPPERANNFNTFTMVPKQFSVDQLETGLHWLIRELYRPKNVLRRFHEFFDEFDASPKAKRLRIPRTALDVQSLAILARLGRYLLLRGSSEERALLKGMMARAKRSAHPQRFAFAVTVFLQATNVKSMLERLNPDLDRVMYPEPRATEPSASAPARGG